MQTIKVKLEAFEGPFDLLYHLIEKNEIDIYDIPIAQLTDQYLEYLDSVQDRNMDTMSEFLVMAATLLEIKSKMLLPVPKNEQEETQKDPREELVAKLIEYKKFKDITDNLKQKREHAALLLFKQEENGLKRLKKEKHVQELDEFLEGITLNDIYKAFEEVMRRKEVKIDKVRSQFQSVERDLYTIEERMDYIKDLLILNPKVTFDSIFREDTRKIEIVVTFLALLELIKCKEVTIKQEKTFDEIIITNYFGSDKNEIE